MAYTYPIGPGLVQGRTDEGVDFSGAGPLYALGDGTILSTAARGWPGGAYILLHLTGPGNLQGRYVYYAENIAPAVAVGQRVTSGQVIGYARGAYPFIEIGWGTATPGITAAAWHYTEGMVTPEGRQFLGLLRSMASGGQIVLTALITRPDLPAEPSITTAAVPAVTTLGGLAHRAMPGYGRGVRAITAAAARLYSG